MPVPQQFFSVDKVAELLGLHVRTVRNYVRERKLKAVRIGKQYRIAAEDLAALTGRPVTAFRAEPVQRHRHVEVSSIVEIDAISPETVHRITTLLVGAASAGSRNEEAVPRIETIYDEQRARLKVILVGSLQANASFFRLIATVLES